MSVPDIINSFLEKKPKKRTIDKRWKHLNPEKYEAAKKLYDMGYRPQDIAEHVGCKYDVLRKTFVRDGIIVPKKYKKQGGEK
jgi:uncharacterized protein YjcR